MSDYVKKYEEDTGKKAPVLAHNLDLLFDKIKAGATLPPRGQQAVDAGLTAHALNDAKAMPELYRYYQWILKHCFAEIEIKELPAKLIGMAFTCANVFQTDLPQPMTLNPWQIDHMMTFPLKTKKVLVIENNGVFAWLWYLHPTWPLINQEGNDFNPAYVKLMQRLEQRGVQFSYLGDLDSKGIQMADHLLSQLAQTQVETLMDLQMPGQVVDWLNRYGKPNRQRTRQLTINNPVLKQEMQSINLFGKFVEQEQLISEYDVLISKWLLKP